MVHLEIGLALMLVFSHWLMKSLGCPFSLVIFYALLCALYFWPEAQTP